MAGDVPAGRQNGLDGKEFAADYWRCVWENITLPQEVRPAEIPEVHRILTSILPGKRLSLIEIGCAPGRWMAYFARQFGFSVNGVEYVSRACEMTKENLDTLSVQAKIYNEDFFKFKSERYDVVFSAGFLEHFHQAGAVVSRLAELCGPGGFVITLIPSTEGLNRWISKTFRPQVAAGHFPINLSELTALHQASGLRTLYADHIGGLQILPPLQKNRFAEEHPAASFVLNSPFRLWNLVIKKLSSATGIYPKIGWLTSSILYVGQKS
jgi:cyclopropane fatty-acyl-phospholipid synthase-like methyltransferase